MTQHQEYAAKQRENAISSLANVKDLERKKDLVKMTLPNVKGYFMIERKRVALRLSQGYELAPVRKAQPKSSLKNK